jgi:hypothetical protein
MSLAQIQQVVTLTQINCGECGGTYAINERYRQQKQDESKTWNCPYCKVSWGYASQSEAARLRKLLEAEQRNSTFLRNNAASEREARERTERRLSATKGAKTRLQNRIKNGVCPCCTRTFMNLQRHMAMQHPEFTATTDVAATV